MVSPPTAVDLTLENVATAVEGVKNWGRYAGLGTGLHVTSTKLQEIERLYSTVEEKVRAVLEYWWAVDPSPSWRRIISALDNAHEHQIADQIRHNAEPLTDSTLTLTNMTKAVAGGYWRYLWISLKVPDSVHNYSHTDDQNVKAVMKYWLQYGPNPSWSTLAGVLYYWEEHTALKRVMEYIQQPTDPTLTLTNLCTTLEESNPERNLAYSLRIPLSKENELRRQYSDPVQYRQALLCHWLSNHPVPSWKGVAEALYQSWDHKILKNVLDTFSRGITLYGLCLQYIEDHYEYFSPPLTIIGPDTNHATVQMNNLWFRNCHSQENNKEMSDSVNQEEEERGCRYRHIKAYPETAIGINHTQSLGFDLSLVFIVLCTCTQKLLSVFTELITDIHLILYFCTSWQQ